jgi:putative solute:sodium symporter small subunit
MWGLQWARAAQSGVCRKRQQQGEHVHGFPVPVSVVWYVVFRRLPVMEEKPLSEKSKQEYWKKNITLIGILLVIWASVSYGCGILFVEALNNVKMPLSGMPLGFWFAQQGSIYVFVVMIFVYAILMDLLDRQYDVHE